MPEVKGRKARIPTQDGVSITNTAKYLIYFAAGRGIFRLSVGGELSRIRIEEGKPNDFLSRCGGR